MRPKGSRPSRWGYVPFVPAIWLYAGHMLLIALISIRMLALTPDLERGDHVTRGSLCGNSPSISPSL